MDANKLNNSTSSDKTDDLLVKDMTSVYEYDYECLRRKNSTHVQKVPDSADKSIKK